MQAFVCAMASILWNWYERLIISLTSDALLIESSTSFSVIAAGSAVRSLRLFMSPPTLLLLYYWHNCTGCLRSPEVWECLRRAEKKPYIFKGILTLKHSSSMSPPCWPPVSLVNLGKASSSWAVYVHMHIYVSYLWKTEIFIYKYGTLIFVKHLFSICWNRKLAASVL